MTLPAGIIVTTYPDRTDYHLGTLWSGAPLNLGPYVTNDGTDVPAHWWNAVFRDRKSPITIKRSPADIVAANQMFPYGDTGAKVVNVTAPPYTPMGSSSIMLYMPTTGERPDIGLCSDASAHFMRTGDAAAMLAWAQCAASCPVKFRDENTGKPISLLQYPKANCYPDSRINKPWLNYGPPDNPDGTGYQHFGGNWGPQQAHYCEFGSYLAFLATLDTGLLEDLQYSANFTTGICDAYISTDKITITFGEMRGMAWAFRNLFMAHTATKYAESLGILPDTCHPSSYWKTLLDNQLAHQIPCMTDPNNQTFRLLGGGNRFGPWQCDYVLAALAFGILTGHSDWVPLYLFLLGNVIARTNGTSGYPPGFGVGYYMNRLPWKLHQLLDTNWDPVKDNNGNLVMVPVSGDFDLTAAPMGWPESWVYCATVDPDGSPLSANQVSKLHADPLNGGVAMSLYESCMASRSVLVMAKYLDNNGMAPVKATYPELDTCFINADRMIRNGGSINPRQSVVLDASQAPTTIPPITQPPPVNPPPPPPPPPAVFPVTLSGILAHVNRLRAKVGA